MNPIYYRCIKCKNKLNLNKNFAQCTSCKAEYTFSEGVLMFTRDAPKFMTGDPSFDRQLQQLLVLSKTEGCLNAFRKLAKRKHSGGFNYATDLSRVDFKYLLPLTKESNILEVGAGHGLISLSLAKTAKSVYSLEKIAEHAKFVQLRAIQEGINNLFVACGGGDCVLPYQDNTFDIVILNGVFLWLGFETNYNNVRNVQKKLIKEIYRVLKDKGVLYITTRNKYSLDLNFSKNHHNNRIRGILFLPDALINWLSKKIKGKEYLSGLQSSSKYLDFFRKLGFYTRNLWVPLPNFRYPKEFLDFYNSYKRQTTLANFYEGGRICRHFIHSLPLNIKKRLCYSYSFLLTKDRAYNQTNPSIIEFIINQDAVLRNAEIISVLSGGGPGLASAIIVHLRKNNTRFICKIARFEKLPFLQREWKNLKKIESIGLRKGRLLPKILSCGIAQGFDYSVFPYYSGYHPFNMNRIQRRIMYRFIRNNLLNETKDFLIELALKTKKDNSLSFLDYAEKPFLNFLKTTTIEQIHKVAHRYLKVLRKEWSKIPLVYSHNDLGVNNFIIQTLFPLQFKIVDWESMDEKGFPALDLIKICSSLHVDKKLRDNLLKEYCSKLDFNLEVIPALNFLKLIKIREKRITENQLHLTAIWQDIEKETLTELCSIE